jgi:hypothetical protein
MIAEDIEGTKLDDPQIQKPHRENGTVAPLHK